ncbi:MAG: MBL fold metallo-hydrolase [Rikenellaceae bacterium]|nr:MBL fold metallo-hydrolase [Rikenellaceae bacterium]
MTKLTFLGTGTSQGVPMIGCHCRVCDSPDSSDKRLRSSVLIEQGDVSIVIDSGPDFRQQMLREQVNRLDAILFTHNHKDHIAGLDDVRAYNYIQGVPMDVYGEPYVLETLKREFGYAFARDRYPGVPEINLHRIDREPFQVKGVTVIPIRGYHMRLPVLGFRIGRLAYLTDMNRIDAEEIDRLKGVEILVVNALRHEKHLSHFSLSEALEVIGRVNPDRAYLTHISHQLGRHAEADPRLAANYIYYAYDGLKIQTHDL